MEQMTPGVVWGAMRVGDVGRTGVLGVEVPAEAAGRYLRETRKKDRGLS